MEKTWIKDPSWQCPDCKKHLKTEIGLQLHFAEKHQICKLQISSTPAQATSLAVLSLAANQNTRCLECNVVLKTPSGLLQHIAMTHQTKGTKPSDLSSLHNSVECSTKKKDLCTARSSSVACLEKGCKCPASDWVRSNGLTNVVCRRPMRTIPDAKLVQKVKSSAGNPCQCKNCSKHFFTERERDQHQESYSIKCKYCTLMLCTSSQARLHMDKRHTGSSDAPINVEDDHLEDAIIEALLEEADKDGVFDGTYDDVVEEDTDTEEDESSSDSSISDSGSSSGSGEEELNFFADCAFCSMELRSADEVKLHMFEFHLDELLEPL